MRGDDLAVVERWFAEAENRLPNVAELLTDHGRILEEHDQPERALTYFKRSLVINPNLEATHSGIVSAARKLGDKELEEFHTKQSINLKGKAN